MIEIVEKIPSCRDCPRRAYRAPDTRSHFPVANLPVPSPQNASTRTIHGRVGGARKALGALREPPRTACIVARSFDAVRNPPLLRRFASRTLQSVNSPSPCSCHAIPMNSYALSMDFLCDFYMDSERVLSKKRPFSQGILRPCATRKKFESSERTFAKRRRRKGSSPPCPLPITRARRPWCPAKNGDFHETRREEKNRRAVALAAMHRHDEPSPKLPALRSWLAPPLGGCVARGPAVR